MEKIYYTVYPWNLTDLFIAATDKGLSAISFGRVETEKDFFERFEKQGFVVEKNLKLFESFCTKLDSYFSGKPVEFDETIDLLTGSEFQKKVWALVSRIKYGRIKTYNQIALELGSPKSVRAVGTANGANPLPIVIPCHRVVRSDGGLGGYAGGLDVKDALLRLEGAVI